MLLKRRIVPLSPGGNVEMFEYWRGTAAGVGESEVGGSGKGGGGEEEEA